MNFVEEKYIHHFHKRTTECIWQIKSCKTIALRDRTIIYQGDAMSIFFFVFASVSKLVSQLFFFLSVIMICTLHILSLGIFPSFTLHIDFSNLEMQLIWLFSRESFSMFNIQPAYIIWGHIKCDSNMICCWANENQIISINVNSSP